MTKFFIMAFLGAMIGGATTPSSASSNIDYSVTEHALEKVIEDIAIAGGVPIQFNEKSNIVVRNWRAQGTPSKAIKDLSSRLSLHFNFDGVGYEIATARSLANSVVPVEGRDQASVMRMVRTAFPDFSSGSVRWVRGDQQDVLLVRGTKRFTETIEALVKACEPECRSVRVILGGQPSK